MAARMEYHIQLHEMYTIIQLDVFSSAIEGAEIEREERIQSLKKLSQYSARIFNTCENEKSETRFGGFSIDA
jgi:hypothetical protein